MVKEIESLEEFERETRGPGLVVVDYFATWCGPCKMIAPIMEQLSVKYPEVKFIKVDVDKNQDIASQKGIKAMPTFHFIVKGQLVEEMKGANPQQLEQKIIQHKVDVNPFAGSGNKLSSTTGNELNAREARLKAFGSIETASKPAATPSAAPSAPPAGKKGDDEEDEALQRAMALSLAEQKPAKPAAAATAQDLADLAAAEQEFADLEASEGQQSPEIHTKPSADNGEWDEEMVPVPVNEEILTQLLDMGFTDIRARKSIVHGGTLEGALTWISEHEDDPEIDQPYLVKKSDTIPKPVLTAEEKAKKIEDMKNKIKQRRQDRSKQEKADEIRQEKERRERGQKMDETVEERQRLQRKHEAERLKREKDAQTKERARLKAEIAHDKEVRRLNKGVLPSVLGVDGYNPSIIQYNVPVANEETTSIVPAKRSSEEATVSSSQQPPLKGTATTASSAHPPSSVPAVNTVPKKTTTTSSSSASSSSSSNSNSNSNTTVEQKVDAAIGMVMKYRTAGDGGQALRLLVTFVKNLVDFPTDVKYRAINTDSNAFKTKLAPLVGPLILLKTIGFEKDESDGKLKFGSEPAGNALLVYTVTKLTEAETLYKRMNP